MESTFKQLFPGQQNIITYLRDRETIKKYKKINSFLPEIDDNRIIFYKMYKYKKSNIKYLIENVKEKKIPLYNINKLVNKNELNIDEYIIDDYDTEQYKDNEYMKLCKSTGKFEDISYDIIVKMPKTEDRIKFCDDIDIKDNMYFNKNKTKLYYIHNMEKEKIGEIIKEKTGVNDVIYSDEIPKELSFSENTSKKRKRSSFRGGKKEIKYVKYGKYIRKVNNNEDNKKYIKINGKIFFLKDIKNKYEYIKN